MSFETSVEDILDAFALSTKGVSAGKKSLEGLPSSDHLTLDTTDLATVQGLLGEKRPLPTFSTSKFLGPSIYPVNMDGQLNKNLLGTIPKNRFPYSSPDMLVSTPQNKIRANFKGPKWDDKSKLSLLTEPGKGLGNYVTSSSQGPAISPNNANKKKRKSTSLKGKTFVWSKTSQYRGVSYNQKNRKWKAVITHKGKQHFLGYYTSEEVAAKAYDRASRKRRGTGGSLNFPSEMSEEEEESSAPKTSKYRGVSYCRSNKKWKAVITVKGKQTYLGYHATEEDAAKCYDKAARKIRGMDALTNFPQTSDSESGNEESKSPSSKKARTNEAVQKSSLSSTVKKVGESQNKSVEKSKKVADPKNIFKKQKTETAINSSTQKKKQPNKNKTVTKSKHTESGFEVLIPDFDLMQAKVSNKHLTKKMPEPSVALDSLLFEGESPCDQKNKSMKKQEISGNSISFQGYPHLGGSLSLPGVTPLVHNMRDSRFKLEDYSDIGLDPDYFDFDL